MVVLVILLPFLFLFLFFEREKYSTVFGTFGEERPSKEMNIVSFTYIDIDIYIYIYIYIYILLE